MSFKSTLSAFILLTLTPFAFADGVGNSDDNQGEPPQILPHCTSRATKYKKASQSYGNTILKQWACANLLSVPFADRDKNKLVSQCERSEVLYKEVKPSDRNNYCIYLLGQDDGSPVLTYMSVRLVNGIYTPDSQTITVTVPTED